MKYFSLVIPLLLYLNVFSQNSDIDAIRTHYTEIGKKSGNCEMDCLYLNELKVNANDQPWRAVGNYEKTIQFWYNDDPKQCDECGTDGENVLIKVVIDESGSSYSIHQEYLYLEGDLIFHYHISEDENAKEEYRYYFKDQILIKMMEGQEVINLRNLESAAYDNVQLNSRLLQKQFLNAF
ncbi:MAG: hypothetical protein NXI20_06010 [bacterium]|nr:hypothetical protein [bacterium]